MKKIGITGQSGFIGNHLYNTINLYKEEFTLIDFDKTFFNDDSKLDSFVSQCDVIVHLAAVNRHNDNNILYKTNIELTHKLEQSLVRVNSKAHVIISSSTQEEKDNIYGNSKKEARKILSKWAKDHNAIFTGMIIPNVFGPFGKPHYNSVIATFSHQIAHGETPKIDVDGEMKLIYINHLIQEFIYNIRNSKNDDEQIVNNTSTAKVSEILKLLINFKNDYQNNGEIPSFKTDFEMDLFNTYRCYMDIKNHFPVKFIQHTDPRGSFVEIIRLGIGGQVSFSTTVPTVTRGNHFHTRKIERFAVIKGKALIQLRRIGTSEILNFELNGDDPAYVDMPIWYTHNIKNIGEDTLYTNFWINEAFNPEDADTYFETV